MNKKGLAVQLSKLKGFERPKMALEQYSIDSEIAADALWRAFLNEDIEGKIVGDFGCGSGILGIGALLLGAGKVFFVDKDKDALNVLKDNIHIFGGEGFVYKIFNTDVSDFNKQLDTVVQNPPFGVKREHADKAFLESAFKVAKSVYSFHKLESKMFIEKLCKENGFYIKEILEYKMPLKATMPQHRKKKYFVDVGCWILRRR